MRSIEQEEKIIEETKLLLKLFLETNASDISLSNITGISSSTVGRRLSNKANFISIFGDEGKKIYEEVKRRRQENLKKGKALGGQTTLLNHVYIKNEDGKFQGSTRLRLDLVYPDIASQYKFLAHATMHFNLSLNTLGELFNINEEDLINNLIKYNLKYAEILNNILYSKENDDIGRAFFLNYYRDLLNALKKKDKGELQNLIIMITK